MKKLSLLVYFLLFILLLNSAYAEHNVLLALKDITTDEAVDEVVVFVEFDGQIHSQYIVSGDIVKLSLDDGIYEAVFKVDEPSTPGKDYYGRTSLDIGDGLIQGIFLFPAGSVRGLVKDKLDNVVGGAELKFDCGFDIEVELPAVADKFGSFSIDYIPTGSCKVFATYKGAIGVKEVTVEKGVVKDVEINLDKSIYVPQKNYGIYFAVIFVLIIIFIIFKFRKKLLLIIKKIEKKEEKKEAKEEKKEVKEIPETKVSEKEEEKKEEIKPSKRAEDIMATLNPKEKKVTGFLLENNNESYQAKVRYATGIPRTTLARVLISLEGKKIVKIEKVGKAVKIKLTDWFLGKE
ncbi:hypothetical protein KY361_00160 [Candidatus Woesearchaeota archaeon]|nr:hypothetical protein [Candidatus Woesearchaeota archaeon]